MSMPLINARVTYIYISCLLSSLFIKLIKIIYRALAMVEINFRQTFHDSVRSYFLFSCPFNPSHTYTPVLARIIIIIAHPKRPKQKFVIGHWDLKIHNDIVATAYGMFQSTQYSELLHSSPT